METAGLTARHLIFRLHSIKLEGSGQLVSTMTFQQPICHSGLQSQLTGKRDSVSGQTGGGELMHDWMLQLLISLICSAALCKLQRHAVCL